LVGCTEFIDVTCSMFFEMSEVDEFTHQSNYDHLISVLLTKTWSELIHLSPGFLWLEVSWDIDNGWFLSLGSDPIDEPALDNVFVENIERSCWESLLKQRGFWNGFVDEGIRSSEVFDKKDVKDDACDADGVCHPPRNTDGPTIGTILWGICLNDERFWQESSSSSLSLSSLSSSRFSLTHFFFLF